MVGIFPDKGGNCLQAYLLPTYPNNYLSDRTLSLQYNSCLWVIHHNRFMYYRLFYNNVINKKMLQIGLSSCLRRQWTLKWVLLVCLVLMEVQMGYPCAWVKFSCQLYRASLLSLLNWHVGLTGVESTFLGETRSIGRTHEILQHVYNLNLNKSPHSLNQVVRVAFLLRKRYTSGVWTSYSLGTSISIASFYSFHIKKNYLLNYKSHLGKHEKVSGQKINLDKTTFF